MCSCVGCWISWEVTKQACCLRLTENVPEELTLSFPSLSPPPTALPLTPSPFFLLIFSLFLQYPGVPLPLRTLNLKHYLSYQNHILSSFSSTSMFHPSPSISLLSCLYCLAPLLSPISFSSSSSLSIWPQLSPECLLEWQQQCCC